MDESEVGPSDTPKAPLSMRSQIFKAINETLREDQTQRLNTGANRLNTWTSINKLSAPGGRSAEQVESLQGNSLNAELAAGGRATKVREFKCVSTSESISNVIFCVEGYQRA